MGGHTPETIGSDNPSLHDKKPNCTPYNHTGQHQKGYPSQTTYRTLRIGGKKTNGNPNGKIDADSRQADRNHSGPLRPPAAEDLVAGALTAATGHPIARQHLPAQQNAQSDCKQIQSCKGPPPPAINNHRHLPGNYCLLAY